MNLFQRLDHEHRAILEMLSAYERFLRTEGVDPTDLPRFLVFFREFADMTDAGPPDFAEIAELAARYQLPFARPEWLPDVIARYNLTPPPG